MSQSIKEKLREVSREFRWKPYPISDIISLLNEAADSLDEKDTMQLEIDKLRQLAATCYAGLGGECNLPEAWLNALDKAANGEDFTYEGLLPYHRQGVCVRKANTSKYNGASGWLSNGKRKANKKNALDSLE